MTGEFAIEAGYAREQLARYLEELSLVEKGVKYSDLGIAERRHAMLPGVIVIDNAVRTVQDPAVLQNASLTPPGSFAHLKLQSVMRAQDGLSTRGINSLIQDFNAAFTNDNIEGILLETNTGGGEVTAAQILKSVIEDAPKAVVVYAHMMASGGVLGTLAADELIASGPGARIGSIGTFMSLPKGYAELYNNYYTDIYADKSTNKNKAFRKMLEGDLSDLRADINETNEYFLAEVKKYRELKGDVNHTLSGELFFANEAKKRGLIDSIGSFQ